MYVILSGVDGGERIAMVLNRVEGLLLEDIARATGTSLVTFWRRLASWEAKFFIRAKNRSALDSLRLESGAP